jgi:hypothetical protein
MNEYKLNYFRFFLTMSPGTYIALKRSNCCANVEPSVYTSPGTCHTNTYFHAYHSHLKLGNRAWLQTNRSSKSTDIGCLIRNAHKYHELGSYTPCQSKRSREYQRGCAGGSWKIAQWAIRKQPPPAYVETTPTKCTVRILNRVHGKGS